MKIDHNSFFATLFIGLALAWVLSGVWALIYSDIDQHSQCSATMEEVEITVSKQECFEKLLDNANGSPIPSAYCLVYTQEGETFQHGQQYLSTVYSHDLKKQIDSGKRFKAQVCRPTKENPLRFIQSVTPLIRG